MIRTRKLPFIKSIASPAVLLSSVLAIAVGFVIILTPLHTVFDFATLPSSYWSWFIGINLAYLVTVELAKRIYIRVTQEWI